MSGNPVLSKVIRHDSECIVWYDPSGNDATGRLLEAVPVAEPDPRQKGMTLTQNSEHTIANPYGDVVRLMRRRAGIRRQPWRWRRVAPNGRTLAWSGESYVNREHCLMMAKRCNPGCPVVLKGDER